MVHRHLLPAESLSLPAKVACPQQCLLATILNLLEGPVQRHWEGLKSLSFPPTCKRKSQALGEKGQVDPDFLLPAQERKSGLFFLEIGPF